MCICTGLLIAEVGAQSEKLSFLDLGNVIDPGDSASNIRYFFNSSPTSGSDLLSDPLYTTGTNIYIQENTNRAIDFPYIPREPYKSIDVFVNPNIYNQPTENEIKGNSKQEPNRSVNFKSYKLIHKEHQRISKLIVKRYLSKRV